MKQAYDTTVISNQVTSDVRNAVYRGEIFKYDCFSIGPSIRTNVWNVVNAKTIWRLSINLGTAYLKD